MIVEAKLERRQVKCVVVGDQKVGKTSLIYAAVNKERPSEKQLAEHPSVHRKIVYWDTHRHEVEIFDTASYEKHRLGAFEDVDVVVLCFAVNGYKTFRRSKVEWARRIQTRFPEKPLILVGTKMDIRDDRIDPSDVDLVYDVKAAQIAERLEAEYVACSAKKMENVDRVFEEVVIASAAAKRERQGAENPEVISYISVIPSFNPVVFTRRCYPPLKQSYDNVIECWKNPLAFCTAKRRLRCIVPFMAAYIPVEPEESHTAGSPAIEALEDDCEVTLEPEELDSVEISSPSHQEERALDISLDETQASVISADFSDVETAISSHYNQETKEYMSATESQDEAISKEGENSDFEQ